MITYLSRHFRLTAYALSSLLVGILVREALRYWGDWDFGLHFGAILAAAVIAFCFCGSWPWLFSMRLKTSGKQNVAVVFMWIGILILGIGHLDYWQIGDFDSVAGPFAGSGIILGALALVRRADPAATAHRACSHQKRP